MRTRALSRRRKADPLARRSKHPSRANMPPKADQTPQGAEGRRKRNYSEDESRLINAFVIKHYDVLYGAQSQTLPGSKRRKLWQRLTDRVNDLGMEERTVPEVKKRWQDVKIRVKAKVLKLHHPKASQSATGKRPSPLTVEEKAIAAVTRWRITSGPGLLDTATQELVTSSLKTDTPQMRSCRCVCGDNPITPQANMTHESEESDIEGNDTTTDHDMATDNVTAIDKDIIMDKDTATDKDTVIEQDMIIDKDTVTDKDADHDTATGIQHNSSVTQQEAQTVGSSKVDENISFQGKPVPHNETQPQPMDSHVQATKETQCEGPLKHQHGDNLNTTSISTQTTLPTVKAHNPEAKHMMQESPFSEGAPSTHSRIADIADELWHTTFPKQQEIAQGSFSKIDWRMDRMSDSLNILREKVGEAAASLAIVAKQDKDQHAAILTLHEEEMQSRGKHEQTVEQLLQGILEQQRRRADIAHEAAVANIRLANAFELFLNVTVCATPVVPNDLRVQQDRLRASLYNQDGPEDLRSPGLVGLQPSHGYREKNPAL